MIIKGKIAVLTGTSSGLGAAITENLVQKGAKVYGLARNSEALTQLRDRLGDQFQPVRMDISNREGVIKWIDKTFSEGHSPDILINNAGAGSFGKIDEIDAEEWLNMVNVNLNGLYFMTSKIVAWMKRNAQTTHIINIGSILGTLGRAGGAAYCTTKFGVRGFSEALFKELRFDNIKVTCLNPGSIDTDFFKTSGVDAHGHMLQPKDLAHTVTHVLETPDNMLINEMTIRPLNPKPPKS